MNGIGFTFTFVASLLLLSLPRRWAAIPLLMGAAWMTRGQVLELGPAHLTVMRVLVFVGFIRVLARGEQLTNGKNPVDRWVILWAVILIATSAFHTSEAWVYRAGLVWTDLGCYFLFRIFLSDWQDVVRAFKATCVILIPVALLMVVEKETRDNLFGVLGGVNRTALIRDGRIRASGPFAHPILAGTVGATCFAMAMCLWRRHRMKALLGLAAGIGIVGACTSSGPILMVAFTIGAFMLWPFRKKLGLIRWLTVFAIVALAAVMNDPVYFLVARIDISGGSQGYYRAQLIRSSIEHLDEWWLAGTDQTRHWMATGIYANTNHTDITNHVLAMGVMGGLLLMAVFVLILVAGFRAIGKALKDNEKAPSEQQFLIWALGALLFGHVVNFMSISLFDQSIVFFYLILGAIGAVQLRKPAVAAAAQTPQSSGTTTRTGISGTPDRDRARFPETYERPTGA